MSDCKCENGMLEIDDMWYRCPRCVISSWPDAAALVEKHYPMTVKPETAAQYVRRIADLMGLRDWKIVIVDDTCGEEDFATVSCVYGQKHANVSLCSTWNDLDGNTQRGVIVHELTHCHLSQLASFASDMMQGKGHATGVRAWYLHEELVTDAISVAWAPSLPLPEGGRCAR